MTRLEIARRYFEGLRRADPGLVSSLFRQDAAIDDYTGGHHPGSAGIQAFVSGLGAGEVYISEPEAWLEEADRLVVWGHVGLVNESQRECVRWIFHFDGDEISHLGNSRVDFVYAG